MRLVALFGMLACLTVYAQTDGQQAPSTEAVLNATAPTSLADFYTDRARLLNFEKEMIDQRVQQARAGGSQAALPDGITVQQLEQRSQAINGERQWSEQMAQQARTNGYNPYMAQYPGYGYAGFPGLANPYGYGLGIQQCMMYPQSYGNPYGTYGNPLPSLAGCDLSSDSNTISCPQAEYVRSRAVSDADRDTNGERQQPSVSTPVNFGTVNGGTGF